MVYGIKKLSDLKEFKRKLEEAKNNLELTKLRLFEAKKLSKTKGIGVSLERTIGIIQNQTEKIHLKIVKLEKTISYRIAGVKENQKFLDDRERKRTVLDGYQASNGTYMVIIKTSERDVSYTAEKLRKYLKDKETKNGKK